MPLYGEAVRCSIRTDFTFAPATLSRSIRSGACCCRKGASAPGAFRVSTPGGDSHTFDSFECAIHALAPTCEYCDVKVIGHGVEADGRFYCCAHCASMAGAEGVSDRA